MSTAAVGREMVSGELFERWQRDKDRGGDTSRNRGIRFGSRR